MKNEMRPIDANALMEQVKAIHRAVDTSKINTDYDTGFHSATSQIQGLIAYMPTVDAAPVIHGEWIVCGDGDYVPFMCSHCGKTTAYQYKIMYGKYCPNCGAKMDLEV